MTNRQARLLFGLLADLSTKHSADPPHYRLAVENVAAGAMMTPAEVRAILDHLDDEIAKASAERVARGVPFSKAEDAARIIAIARTVTDEGDEPIGPGSSWRVPLRDRHTVTTVLRAAADFLTGTASRIVIQRTPRQRGAE